MTRIDKEALKEKKEAARAAQYPRTEVPAHAPVEKKKALKTLEESTYRELQAMAKSLELGASGTKKELLERLKVAGDKIVEAFQQLEAEKKK